MTESLLHRSQHESESLSSDDLLGTISNMDDLLVTVNPDTLDIAADEGNTYFN